MNTRSMRIMPTILSDGTIVPLLTHDKFNARLRAIAGRELTTGEIARGEKMAGCNWTLRVIATELFGAAIVDAHFSTFRI